MGISTEILKILSREPRQTPQTLQKVNGASISTIRNALVVLSDLGLTQKKARGLYEITPLGQHVLEMIYVRKLPSHLKTESAKQI
jgi:predicted transcriptional regulator